MDGNHWVRWVHVPGGYATCFPQQSNSPRAEPEPTVTVTVAQVETVLRSYIATLDYDIHKNIECGEETGKDTYAAEAAEFMSLLQGETHA